MPRKNIAHATPHLQQQRVCSAHSYCSESFLRKICAIFPSAGKGDSFSLYHSLALTRLALPDTILCGTTSALLLLCCFWYSAITAGSSISSSVMRRESASVVGGASALV